MDRRKVSRDHIDTIVRAIIMDEEGKKMLFCSPKNKRYYYLPGGHVKFGETTRTALKRELMEETGIVFNETKFVFAGCDENIFFQNNEKKHEINFFFKAGISFPSVKDIQSREDHIAFTWIPIGEASQFPILPESLREKCKTFVFEEHLPLYNM